jgi:hypothetical protein
MASGGNDHDGAAEAPGDPVVTSTDLDQHAASDPVGVAAAFVTAVAWGEHMTIWELLSPEARRVVLRVAVGRGMDEALAARLRDGTAARVERETFLTDLVNGLRADLRGNDLDALNFQPDPDWREPDPDRAHVMLLAPLVSAMLGDPLPVASLEMVRERGQWRIERLLPRAQT